MFSRNIAREANMRAAAERLHWENALGERELGLAYSAVRIRLVCE